MCRRSSRCCRAVEDAAVKEDLEVTMPDRKRLVDKFLPEEYGNFGGQELSSGTVRGFYE
jgi:hypothetical protein